MKLRSVCSPLLVIGCWTSFLAASTVAGFDRDYEHFKKQAFIAYNSNYLALRQERVRRAVGLGKQVFQLEAQGHHVTCAHQILAEIQWRLSATAEFRRIDQRLDALQNVLEHPDLEAAADKQDPEDGS